MSPVRVRVSPCREGACTSAASQNQSSRFGLGGDSTPARAKSQTNSQTFEGLRSSVPAGLRTRGPPVPPEAELRGASAPGASSRVSPARCTTNLSGTATTTAFTRTQQLKLGMPSPFAVPIELTVEERAQLEAWERRRTSAQALALRSRIVLAAAEGPNNSEIARAARGRGQLGAQVAQPLRRASAWTGLTDEPRPGQPRKITDAKVEEVIVKTLETTPEGRDALVDALDGGRGRSQPDRGAPDLEGVRAAAAPPGDVEALPGPAVHREGPRRRRALSQPARARGRALRRREVPDPGAGPHRADPADAPGRARARDPRLQALGHLQSLRRAGPHHRPGDRPPAQPPSRDRVQAVPADARPRGPGRTRRPRRARQQLHAQDAGDPEMADRAPPVRRCTSPRPAARG